MWWFRWNWIWFGCVGWVRFGSWVVRRRLVLFARWWFGRWFLNILLLDECIMGFLWRMFGRCGWMAKMPVIFN